MMIQLKGLEQKFKKLNDNQLFEREHLKKCIVLIS